MYVRIGKSDFLVTAISGKSVTELQTLFTHVAIEHLTEIAEKYGTKEKTKTKRRATK